MEIICFHLGVDLLNQKRASSCFWTPLFLKAYVFSHCQLEGTETFGVNILRNRSSLLLDLTLIKVSTYLQAIDTVNTVPNNAPKPFPSMLLISERKHID